MTSLPRPALSVVATCYDKENVLSEFNLRSRGLSVYREPLS